MFSRKVFTKRRCYKIATSSNSISYDSERLKAVRVVFAKLLTKAYLLSFVTDQRSGNTAVCSNTINIGSDIISPN